MTLKGYFSNTHLLSKFFLLFSLIIISYIIHTLLAIFTVYLSFEDGVNLCFPPYDLSSVVSVNVAKIIQFLGSIGFFITPILIYGYLVNFEFNFKKSISRQSILIVLVIMVLITPLVSFLLEWNMAINVPDWISEYDKKSDDIVLAFLKMNNYWDLVFNIIILAIIPAIGEELLFRGLLQQSLIKKIGDIHIAIFITALIFSAFHLHFSGLFPRILLGLVLGYLFYWSKSLWIPIIAHFLNNAMFVVVSYPDFKSFNFIQNDQHLDSSIVNDTSIYLAFFSFISVMLLMFLFYKNSRIKKD